MKIIHTLFALILFSNLAFSEEPLPRNDQLFDESYLVAIDALCKEGGVSSMFSVSSEECNAVSTSVKELCKSYVLETTSDKDEDQLRLYMEAQATRCLTKEVISFKIGN